MEAAVSFAQPQFRGSIIKEYLLTVNPREEVSKEIMQEKKLFDNQYGIAGSASKPQIIVAIFLAKEEMEETLLRWMHRILNTKPSFSVALNNYSGSPATHSVFLRVQDHEPFKRLAKELKVIDELVKSNGLPKAHLVSAPHLTIASTQDKSLYEKAMLSYSRKEFHAEFEVKELKLLKRTHHSDACEQVSVFRLQP